MLNPFMTLGSGSNKPDPNIYYRTLSKYAQENRSHKITDQSTAGKGEQPDQPQAAQGVPVDMVIWSQRTSSPDGGGLGVGGADGQPQRGGPK